MMFFYGIGQCYRSVYPNFHRIAMAFVLASVPSLALASTGMGTPVGQSLMEWLEAWGLYLFG